MTPDEFVTLTRQYIEGDYRCIGPLTARRLCDLVDWYRADAERLRSAASKARRDFTQLVGADILPGQATYRAKMRIQEIGTALAEHKTGPPT